MADHTTTTSGELGIAEAKGFTVSRAPIAGDDLATWFERFDTIYREAAGDVSRIPWAHARPCPWMVDWLNRRGREFVRAGARVAVTGCGLGNDVAALLERGYEACGLDVCPSAIESARRRFPRHIDAFEVADLLDLPSRLRHRFDLVVEVHTLQSLPPGHREGLAAGIGMLLKPRGHVLAIARGRSESVPLDQVDGPPFAFTARELETAFAGAQLWAVEPVESFIDPGSAPVLRHRGLFGRLAR